MPPTVGAHPPLELTHRWSSRTVGAHAGRFRCQPPTARAPYAGATDRARACRRAGCSACPGQTQVPPTECKLRCHPPCKLRCHPPDAGSPWCHPLCATFAGATHRARACRRAGCSACPGQIVVPPTECKLRCHPPDAGRPWCHPLCATFAGATHRARPPGTSSSACWLQCLSWADPGATHHVRPPLCASITARGIPMTSRHIVKGFRSRCHPPLELTPLELTPVGSGVWPRCHPPRWVPIPVPPTERLTPVPPTERPPTERPPKVKKAINVMLPGFCSACFCRYFGILRCLSSSGFLRDLSSSEFCGACPSSRLPVLPAD